MLKALRRDPAWMTAAWLVLGLLGVFLVLPLVGMLGKSFIGADGHAIPRITVLRKTSR